MFLMAWPLGAATPRGPAQVAAVLPAQTWQTLSAGDDPALV